MYGIVWPIYLRVAGSKESRKRINTKTMNDHKYYPIQALQGEISWPRAENHLDHIRASLWIETKVERPKRGQIVWMYSESNNEFSVGHFTLERAGVRVTHWQPLVEPKK